MLTALQMWKFAQFKATFGPMSAQEALELAIDAEQYKKTLDYTDPAWNHFSQQMRMLEEYACLIELSKPSIETTTI